ncbi:MAG: aldehyde dehydrogenase family protein, partial [Verrucomicrobiota bacterium]
GDLISKSKGIALVSATGSTKMGRSVGSNVARRLGRSILELGGNNAAIVAPSAPIDLALDSIVFSAVATAGQRCTTLRRLIVHEAIYDELLEKLVKKYASLTIGDPFDPTNLVGPLVSYEAVELYKDTLKEAERSGARVLCSGTMKGNFVAPAIIEAHKSLDYYSVERFVPVLNVIKYSSFGEALQIHNSTRYALSSSIFTQNLLEAEKFLSSAGSDCGIVNVNIGTCGAEIGGAFGGNKDTGGGRVAGSDSWKNYMRNSTQTINYSGEMLLAQGVRFGD